MLLAATAHAHDFDPGVLALEEQAPNVFSMVWTEPVDPTGVTAQLVLQYPDGCEAQAARSQLVCAHGLQGRLGFTGAVSQKVQVMVSVRWRDGARFEALLDAEGPHAEVERRPHGAGLAWAWLGLEHVLLGPDHLAFVLGVLLVVGLRRRLVWAITSFTVAHSVTLALSALGLLRLPSPPVEACIALSVLLVAREATHDRRTLTRRAPWVVTFGFGLIHGLGFSGALAELGLPEASKGFALVWFNLGIEAGQLLVVGLALVVAKLLGEKLRPLVRPLAYGLGAVGAFWLADRVASFFPPGATSGW